LGLLTPLALSIKAGQGASSGALGLFGNGLTYCVEDLVILGATYEGKFVIDKYQGIIEIALRHFIQQGLAALFLCRIHHLIML
jgi:hypothetical protein